MNMPNYPRSVADVLNPRKCYKPAVIRAVRRFAKMKPWRGTIEERQEKFRWLNRALAEAYGVEEPQLVFGTDESRDSGSSCYLPGLRTIILRGRLSVVSYLHEFAHFLYGRSERTACAWSVNLFRRAFPKSFARCRSDGHMLRARPHQDRAGEGGAQ
jgi:hypothetical protein